MRTELLIGCGNRRNKDLFSPEHKEWSNLVTLDIDLNCNPDIIWDLNQFPYGYWKSPFERMKFDEIHAYEVLEHCGRQGDYKFFFTQWNEFYNILKPGGVFYGSVPMWNSPWAWGDPSHTRVIPPGSFVFLDQDEYTKQVGVTKMSDFRDIYFGNFSVVLQATETNLYFKLTAK